MYFLNFSENYYSSFGIHKSFHFEQLKGALGEELMKEFYGKLGWSEEQFNEEILFTEQILQAQVLLT